MADVQAQLSRTLVAAAALVSAAVVLTILAGCSSAERDRPVPTGFRQFQANGFTFSYPATWTVKQGPDGQGRPAIQVDGPKNPAGLAQGQIRVGFIARPKLPFEEQLGQYRAGSFLTSRQIRTDARVKLAGAQEAHRFVSVYTTRLGDGTQARVEATDLFVLTEKNVLIDMTVVAPEGGGAAARLPEVLASFQVTSG